MRKNINKLVAFAIGISVMSGSIMPAFADDVNQSTSVTTNQSTNATVNQNTNVNNGNQNSNNYIYVQNGGVTQKPVLTLKEAIDATVDNSEKLALQAKQIKLYQDQLEIQHEKDDFTDSDDDFPYDKLEVLVKQSKEQKEYMKDQIAQDITNKYNDLISKQKTLEKTKKQIEIKTKTVSDTELKKKLGMEIETNAQNAEIELQTLKNNLQNQQNVLKINQEYFKVLTNRDVTQYSLEEDPKYEVFRINGSEDEYFDKIIDKYQKYDKKMYDLTKDHLKDIKDTDGERPKSSDEPKAEQFTKAQTNADGSVTRVFDNQGYEAAKKAYLGKWDTYGGYLQQKFTNASSLVSLDEAKKSLKNGLKQSYASLLEMENSINAKKATIQVKNKELSNAKLKYDMGLMIKSEYDNQVLNNIDLETDLRTSINSYNTLKNQIQKPWLPATGAGASASAASGK